MRNKDTTDHFVQLPVIKPILTDEQVKAMDETLTIFDPYLKGEAIPSQILELSVHPVTEALVVTKMVVSNHNEVGKEHNGFSKK